MPPRVEVNVRGLGKVDKKLKSALFADTVIEEVTEKLAKRMRRGGKGIGSRRNTVTAESRGLTVAVKSTLISPRTKGTAWRNYQKGLAKKILPRLIRSAVRKIRARWESDSYGN